MRMVARRKVTAVWGYGSGPSRAPEEMELVLPGDGEGCWKDRFGEDDPEFVSGHEECTVSDK